MSKWRRLAVDLFPDYRRLYQDPETSYYWVFFDQLSLAVEYHQQRDVEHLKPIYEFAKWCWKQGKRAPDIQNAAAVAFYEHLVDSEITRNDIPDWIEPELFADLLDIFASRLDKEKYEELVNTYNRINGTSFTPEWEKLRTWRESFWTKGGDKSSSS